MLAPAFLITSTLCGLIGSPPLVAVLCGLGLAAVSVSERTNLIGRALATGSLGTLSVMGLGSVLLGQLASIGTFAVGRFLVFLLID